MGARGWSNGFHRLTAVAALFVVAVTGAACANTGGAPVGESPSSSQSNGPALATPPDRASNSDRGVVGKTINVVFPVVNLSSLAGQLGFAADPEFAEQIPAIKFYVDQINDDGGINGRKINAIISNFDPTNESDMRALCKDWTEGNPPVFAVIDGLGAWSGDNELCITEEGKTPMLAEWTTATDWTTMGSPYLWWLGPDQAVILHTLVTWAYSSDYIGPTKKLGIVVGDRTSDQLALNKYLLPYLTELGVTPVVETLPAEPSEVATTNSDAPLIIQKLRAAGVTVVIPLIPENAFFPYLAAETSQQFFPRLLLSDYESTIELGLGLIPTPYNKALNGQEGVTVQTLGGIDDDRPESEGGYDPGVRSCWTSFRKSPSFPFPKPPVHPGPWIEEQGPIASWCQAIRLFAEAAKMAGPDLTRRSFVEAMASIRNYPGTLSPTLSYGPNKFYGPTEYRVVSLHSNSASNNECINNYKGGVQQTCWRVVQNWRPLVAG
jgi:Periplasmic binding protein